MAEALPTASEAQAQAETQAETPGPAPAAAQKGAPSMQPPDRPGHTRCYDYVLLIFSAPQSLCISEVLETHRF